ncbi:MAG: lipopolysaccharide kinase InaA family protein [bacterium]
MSNSDQKSSPRLIIDEYENHHYISTELARGGQGVVFRTTDVDVAIKQPIDATGQLDKNIDLRNRFQNIRILPLPPRIPISLPLSILRDEPGYVMYLLNDMEPFEVFDMSGKTYRELQKKFDTKKLQLPKWLEKISDIKTRLKTHHYADSGSTKRRLYALSKCAAILARLHSAGLVYGDISLKNVFFGTKSSRDVWLIDADNLRLEMIEGGSVVYTPHYGAPEIVQNTDSSRPRTDCWAFAVMAFSMLTMSHPFIGKKVLEPDDEESGWDTDPASDDELVDLDEKAYAGYLPFVDDKDDDSNIAVTFPPLPRDLVMTSALQQLFQETLGVGRTQPHRRPTMAFWALELSRAHDLSLDCPNCKMSFFADDRDACPYCDTPRPAFFRAKTDRWQILFPAISKEHSLPHRLFNPFSMEHFDDTEYEMVIDVSKKEAKPVRGTKLFPLELSIDFVEAKK